MNGFICFYFSRCCFCLGYMNFICAFWINKSTLFVFIFDKVGQGNILFCFTSKLAYLINMFQHCLRNFHFFASIIRLACTKACNKMRAFQNILFHFKENVLFSLWYIQSVQNNMLIIFFKTKLKTLVFYVYK